MKKVFRKLLSVFLMLLFSLSIFPSDLVFALDTANNPTKDSGFFTELQFMSYNPYEYVFPVDDSYSSTKTVTLQVNFENKENKGYKAGEVKIEVPNIGTVYRSNTNSLNYSYKNVNGFDFGDSKVFKEYYESLGYNVGSAKPESIAADKADATEKVKDWSYTYDSAREVYVFTNNNDIEPSNFKGSFQMIWNLRTGCIPDDLNKEFTGKLFLDDISYDTNTISVKTDFYYPDMSISFVKNNVNLDRRFTDAVDKKKYCVYEVSVGYSGPRSPVGFKNINVSVELPETCKLLGTSDKVSTSIGELTEFSGESITNEGITTYKGFDLLKNMFYIAVPYDLEGLNPEFKCSTSWSSLDSDEVKYKSNSIDISPKKFIYSDGVWGFPGNIGVYGDSSSKDIDISLDSGSDLNFSVYGEIVRTDDYSCYFGSDYIWFRGKNSTSEDTRIYVDENLYYYKSIVIPPSSYERKLYIKVLDEATKKYKWSFYKEIPIDTENSYSVDFNDDSVKGFYVLYEGLNTHTIFDKIQYVIHLDKPIMSDELNELKYSANGKEYLHVYNSELGNVTGFENGDFYSPDPNTMSFYSEVFKKDDDTMLSPIRSFRDYASTSVINNTSDINYSYSVLEDNSVGILSRQDKKDYIDFRFRSHVEASAITIGSVSEYRTPKLSKVKFYTLLPSSISINKEFLNPSFSSDFKVSDEYWSNNTILSYDIKYNYVPGYNLISFNLSRDAALDLNPLDNTVANFYVDFNGHMSYINYFEALTKDKWGSEFALIPYSQLVDTEDEMVYINGLTHYGKEEDKYDLNNNGLTDYTDYVANGSFNITLANSTLQNIFTSVRSSQTQNSYIVDNALVKLGETYSTKLSFRNANAKARNILLRYDIDKSKEWNGVFDSVDTSYLVSKGYAPKVYYTLKEDAETPRIDKDTDELNISSDWVTSVSDEDKANIKSIVIDASKGSDGKTKYLEKGVLIYALLNFTAPTDINLLNKDTEAKFYADYVSHDTATGTEINQVNDFESSSTGIKLVQGTADIKLNTKDSVSNKNLQGLKYSLYDSQGALIRENLVSDLNGNVYAVNIPVGGYYFVQTYYFDGYKIEENKHIDFSVLESDIGSEKTINNYNDRLTGKVTIKVLDCDTKKPIDNVNIGLYTFGKYSDVYDMYHIDKSSLSCISTLVTDENGVVNFEGLKWGESIDGNKEAISSDTGYLMYCFSVLEAENYEISDNPYYTEAEDNTDSRYTDRIYSVSDKTVNDEKTFTIYLRSNPYRLRIKLVDVDTGEIVPATFNMMDYNAIRKNSDGSKNFYFNDEDSGCKITGSKYSDYFYNGDTVSVTINLRNLSSDFYEFVDGNTKEYTFNRGSKDIEELVFKVKKIRNVVCQIIKKSAVNTSEVLSGAKYSLYDSKDNLIRDDIVTGEDGVATFELPVGKNYYLIETEAPKHYAINTSKIYYYLYSNHGTLEDGVYYYRNTQFDSLSDKIDLKIIKVDEDTDKRLSGAKFKISRYDYSSSETTVLYDSIETDENGEINLKGVTWDSRNQSRFTIEEIEAPDTYLLDKSNSTRNIYVKRYDMSSLSDDNTTVTISNKRQTGTIYIRKYIKSDLLNYNNGVPTFEYKISGVTDDGEDFTLYKMLRYNSNYDMSDIDGYSVAQLEIKDLPMGTYNIEELGVSRYETDSEIKTVSVSYEEPKNSVVYTTDNKIYSNYSDTSYDSYDGSSVISIGFKPSVISYAVGKELTFNDIKLYNWFSNGLSGTSTYFDMNRISDFYFIDSEGNRVDSIILDKIGISNVRGGFTVDDYSSYTFSFNIEVSNFTMSYSYYDDCVIISEYCGNFDILEIPNSDDYSYVRIEPDALNKDKLAEKGIALKELVFPKNIKFYYQDNISSWGDIIINVPYSPESEVVKSWGTSWNSGSSADIRYYYGMSEHSISLDTSLEDISLNKTEAYRDDKIVLSAGDNKVITSFCVNGEVVTGDSFIMPEEDVIISDIVVSNILGILESKHDYDSNSDEYFTYTNYDLDEFYLNFTSDTYFENSYDKLYIYVDDVLLQLDGRDYATGGSLAGKTIKISGHTVKLRLTSDGSVNKYGFKCTITG